MRKLKTDICVAGGGSGGFSSGQTAERLMEVFNKDVILARAQKQFSTTETSEEQKEA